MSTDDIAGPEEITAKLAEAEDNAANQYETPARSDTGDKPTVIEALARVMADVQAVGKNDRNKEQGFNFRGIDAVINAAGPAFRRHGIVPTVKVIGATYRDLTSKKGNAMRECVVDATYRFYGPAGDWVESTVKGEAMDSGDKGTSKAQSVAYRIALIQTLCIPTHEPDPDESSYERAAPAARGAAPEVPDGHLHKNDAKVPVLEAARDVPGSKDKPTVEEKARATRAWSNAGLDGRDHVTPDEMAKAARLAKLYREQEPDVPDEDDEPTEEEQELEVWQALDGA